jgi:hypothetical protein
MMGSARLIRPSAVISSPLAGAPTSPKWELSADFLGSAKAETAELTRLAPARTI